MATRLSVNINKFATIRNSRGGNNPDLIKIAQDVERFGGQGITVHPRPDERHIRYQDVYDLKAIVRQEFNIEGNPTEPKFVELVLRNKPHQVTLVPDTRHQLTSNHGWDTVKNQSYLSEIIKEFQTKGIRVSIFVDADEKMIEGAAKTGTDRVELYTESYAHLFPNNKTQAIAPYINAAHVATSCGLGLNAGHDLDLHNLGYFAKNIPNLSEVSIGHALVCDCFYLGLENTIQLYLQKLA